MPEPTAWEERSTVGDVPGRVAAGGEKLISVFLETYAREELQEGWRELRQDAMPSAVIDGGYDEFAEQVARAPREIGRRLAQQHTEQATAAAALASADGLGVLASIEQGAVGPVLDLARDAERMDAMLACAHLGPAVDGASLRTSLTTPLPNGAEIVYGPGVWELPDAILQRGRAAACLAVTGAGIDATLLVAAELSTNVALDRLSIRDCTVLVNGCLLDLRREGAVLSFERVRFIGFDVGAGGSSLLCTAGTLVRFRDCKIAGGYGRSANSGRLWDVRTDALVARFERCTLDGLSLNALHLRSRATAVFTDCTLTNLLDPELPQSGSPPGLEFQSCRLELIPRDSDLSAGFDLAKDLNDLFPDWRARLNR